MERKSISILGSTGSIGTQALDILSRDAEHFRVFALSANRNWSLLAEQAARFLPEYVIIADGRYKEELSCEMENLPVKVLAGEEGIHIAATHPDVDVVLNSLVGFSGFLPTCAALGEGKQVALANKESLVVGGELIHGMVGNDAGQLVPVDSEHSAILQSMAGESFQSIRKLILTASGGPFRDLNRDAMKKVTVEQALNHPNWNMGAKITVDSATMMNKGLEVIEAFWLFGVPLDCIDTVIHPQSIIHSMVQFVDGSTKAQLGIPDMRIPIRYALTYPHRIEADVPVIDWGQMQQWTFEPVDYTRFPCLQLARQAIRSGGFAPAILNAANEVAVERFLKQEIAYIQIPDVVESCLSSLTSTGGLSADMLCEVDAETREMARQVN